MIKHFHSSLWSIDNNDITVTFTMTFSALLVPPHPLLFFPASHDILQSPESSFLTSSSHPPLHPPRALCPSNAPSLHPSFHLPSHPPPLSGQHYEAAEKVAPYMATQKVKNGPTDLNQSQPQVQDATSTVFHHRKQFEQI